MQESPRINQQDRQKITFPGSANPKEISQQCAGKYCQLNQNN